MQYESPHEISYEQKITAFLELEEGESDRAIHLS